MLTELAELPLDLEGRERRADLAEVGLDAGLELRGDVRRQDLPGVDRRLRRGLALAQPLDVVGVERDVLPGLDDQADHGRLGALVGGRRRQTRRRTRSRSSRSSRRRMPSMSWIRSSNAESVSDRAKPVRSVLEILGMKVGAAIAWPGRFTGA